MSAAEFAEQFQLGSISSLEPLGIGHINDTFVATAAAGRFLLQRINESVFKDIDLLMDNVARVTEHLREMGARTPKLLRTASGESFFRDEQGECWRGFEFVEGGAAMPAEEISDEIAEEAGRMFGEFARLMADLPGPPLHPTIPDFHNTPKRLSDFEAAAVEDRAGRVADSQPVIDLAKSYAAVAGRLAGAPSGGVAHNDAKVENVLFDRGSGKAICVVDLDTVMPGSLLHDFGDLVRSTAATAGEEEIDLEKVGVSLKRFSSIARGFVRGCGDVLGEVEHGLLAEAGSVIVYEQALRFLTDHLEGDAYYRISRTGQNLDRARNQLRLLETLEANRDRIAGICDSLR